MIISNPLASSMHAVNVTDAGRAPVHFAGNNAESYTIQVGTGVETINVTDRISKAIAAFSGIAGNNFLSDPSRRDLRLPAHRLS